MLLCKEMSKLIVTELTIKVNGMQSLTDGVALAATNVHVKMSDLPLLP